MFTNSSSGVRNKHLMAESQSTNDLLQVPPEQGRVVAILVPLLQLIKTGVALLNMQPAVHGCYP